MSAKMMARSENNENAQLVRVGTSSALIQTQPQMTRLGFEGTSNHRPSGKRARDNKAPGFCTCSISPSW